MTDAEKQAEEHRLRRTTRHLIFSVVAVAVFAIAFAAVYWWASGRPVDPEPSPPPTSPTSTPQPTPVPVDRETLLLQATTPVGAMGNLLTGLPAQPGRRATLLPLRSDLIVSDQRNGPAALSQTVSGFDTLRPAASVSATVGVRVDASWRLDRKALAGLVDSVAGVPVDVDAPLRVRDEAGEVVLRLPPGRLRLSGTQASWYAVGEVRGQSPELATQRFDTVITSTLLRLPPSDVEIRESLTALGALAPSTIGTQELANYLLDLSDALKAGRAVTVDLPVSEISFAGSSASWLDYSGATPILRARMPYALWQAGVDGPARVLVAGPQDPPGTLGYARTALTGAGLIFVDGRGTPTPPERRTSILVRGTVTLAADVKAALGTPRARIETVPVSPLRGEPWADADVVLGSDYDPGAEETP